MNYTQRIKTNFFLLSALVQVGTTVAGGVVLAALLLLGIPPLRFYIWECAERALAVAVPIGAIAMLLTYRDNNALVAASHHHLQGREIPRRYLDQARAACVRLPLRLLLMTLVLWPATLILIGIWIWAADLVASRDVVRGVACGLLYTPVHALIMFYAVRLTMRRMGGMLREAGAPWFDERQPGLSIRAKLMASFICLALVPLVAGVVIADVQREWQAAQTSLARVCYALEDVYAAGSPGGRDPGAWERAMDDARAGGGLPPSTVFKVADAAGDKIAGSFDLRANAVWREQTGGDKSSLECRLHPVPGDRRFVAARWFAVPGVWVGAETDPYPPVMPFAGRYGAAAALVALVFLASAALGYFAAGDVADPLSELTAGVDEAARGGYVQLGGFLPDDELGGLAFSFNRLEQSSRREMARAARVVGEVRQIIAGLGEMTERVQELGLRQREIIDEQSSLSRQADDDTEKVTRTAGEIKDRARHTESKMKEVSRAAQEAGVLVREFTGLITDVAADSERTWEEMQMLELNYRRLEEVVRIIDDITGRTELLAMNASLEAGGRQDESGSRFGVVASEVQRLSERIAEQTGQINSLFREIRKSSLEMGQSIEEGRYRAAEGPALTKQLGTKLEAIDRRAADAARSMTEIASMTAKQNQALEQMRFMVSEMHSVARVINEVTANADKSLTQLQGQAVRLQQLVTEEPATQPDGPSETEP